MSTRERMMRHTARKCGEAAIRAMHWAGVFYDPQNVARSDWWIDHAVEDAQRALRWAQRSVEAREPHWLDGK